MSNQAVLHREVCETVDCQHGKDPMFSNSSLMAASFPGNSSGGVSNDRQQQLYLWAPAHVFFLYCPVTADAEME